MEDSRFLVVYLRINEPALLRLTQPQLWARASLIVGGVLIAQRPDHSPQLDQK